MLLVAWHERKYAKKAKPKTIQNPSWIGIPLDLRVLWLHQVAEKLPSPGRFFHGFLSYKARVPTWSTRNLGHPASHSASFPSLLGAAATFLTCGEFVKQQWPIATYLSCTEPWHSAWMWHQPLQHLGGWAKSPEPPRSYPRMPGKGLFLKFQPIKKC